MGEDEHPYTLEELFDRMHELEASDLHLKVGSPPVYRVASRLRRAKLEVLTPDRLNEMIKGFLGDERWEELHQRGSLDIGYDVRGGRARVNVFLQRGQVSLAARLIKTHIPTLEELHLPPAIAKVIDFPQGLVLVCGVTGSGKSTTLASILEMMNMKHTYHILTIEDPLEYLHTDKNCIINQREMGLDCFSWPDALRAAVREDPDVILVGEMRDEETFQAALIASETGHLVFGTLHTSSAATTIGRILDLFPGEKHALIRQSLAFNLNSILCQRLIPSFREGIDRVPVMEVMFTNAPIQKAVEQGDDAKITPLIAQGEQEGMQTWTTSFVRMINDNFIEQKVAKQFAPNKEALDMVLKGISVSESALG